MKTEDLKLVLRDVPNDAEVILTWPADHDAMGEPMDSEYAEFAAINYAGKFIIGTTAK